MSWLAAISSSDIQPLIIDLSVEQLLRSEGEIDVCCCQAQSTPASTIRAVRTIRPSWLSAMLLVRSQNGVSICRNSNTPVTITRTGNECYRPGACPSARTNTCRAFWLNRTVPRSLPGSRSIDLKSCQKVARIRYEKSPQSQSSITSGYPVNTRARRCASPRMGATPVMIRAKIASAMTQWNARSISVVTTYPSPLC